MKLYIFNFPPMQVKNILCTFGRGCLFEINQKRIFFMKEAGRLFKETTSVQREKISSLWDDWYHSHLDTIINLIYSAKVDIQ